MQSPKPIYAYLSAAGLATVTLFAFVVYQNFGPQSVLRRFHVAAELSNSSEIGSVTTKDDDPRYLNALIRIVRQQFQSNASYEIVAMKRQRNLAQEPEVVATVEYRYPNSQTHYIAWHVIQGANDWRIDCRATLRSLFRWPDMDGNATTAG